MKTTLLVFLTVTFLWRWVRQKKVLTLFLLNYCLSGRQRTKTKERHGKEEADNRKFNMNHLPLVST